MRGIEAKVCLKIKRKPLNTLHTGDGMISNTFSGNSV